MTRSMTGWVLPALALSCLPASAWSAAGAAPAPKHGPWRFNLRIEQQFRYDDNILGLSQTEQDQIDPGDPVSEDRFGIDEPDDIIWIPEVGLRFTRAPKGARSTGLGLTLRAYDYIQSSVKDYHNFRLSVRQDLNRSRTHRSVLTLAGSRTPSYFVRRLTDDDASAAAGTTIRRDAEFELTTGEIELRQEIVDKVLTMELGYTIERRDYDDAFDERDSSSDVVSASAEIFPTRSIHLRVRPYFQSERRDARGDVTGTTIVDDDVGFDGTLLGVDVRSLWGVDSDHRHMARIFIEGENRDFTTDATANTGQYGREDSITRYGGGYEKEFGPSWKISAAWYHRVNEVSVPGSSPTNYRKNVLAASVTWSVGRRFAQAEPPEPSDPAEERDRDRDRARP